MNSPEKVLGGLSKQAKNKEYRFHRIYRNFYNPEMYVKAYANIYSNTGSATSGVDGETADDFSADKVNKLILKLRNESYQPKPVRRTYIPKKNGKTRPLGIPSFDDRLVQEVCRMMLEEIYEPVFSEFSHGFRPDKSCHTALVQVVNTFKGVNWFVEGDIKGFFDNIDHQTLISILRRRIADERFISLVWKFLRAGYMEKHVYHNTFSGTPQGGIVSPILANIYLSELDNYVQGELKMEMTSMNKLDKDGRPKRVLNPEYERIQGKIDYRKKRLKTCTDSKCIEKYRVEISDLRKQKRQVNYSLGLGDYRNLFYVRYADDFIIGVHGSKEYSQEIKDKLSVFLRDTLKLELSEEKTLITNSSGKARFLNYEILVKENNRFFRRKDGKKVRCGNRNIVLGMPRDTMRNYILEKKIVQDINAEQWRGKARSKLQNLSDLEIVSIYNAEIRGLYNYYSLAGNVGRRMSMIHHMMQYSCLKTLGGKHKLSVKKTRKKHRIGKGWGIYYNTKTEKNKPCYFYNKGFAVKKISYDPKDKKKTENVDPKVDLKPNGMIYAGTTELQRRIIADRCEMCGKETGGFHIHHVKALKDLKGKDEWERNMIARRRKTTVLCRECHARRTAQQSRAGTKTRAKLIAKAKEQSRRAKAILVGTV